MAVTCRLYDVLAAGAPAPVFLSGLAPAPLAAHRGTGSRTHGAQVSVSTGITI